MIATNERMRMKQKKYFVCGPFMDITSVDIPAVIIIWATYLKIGAENKLERKQDLNPIVLMWCGSKLLLQSG